MSESESTEESPLPRGTPFLVRFGGTVGAAAFASLLGSSPAALRMNALITASTGDHSSIDVLREWLTLAGLAIAPMLLLVPLARLAREGLRGFLSSDGARSLTRSAASIFFACTWLWFVTLLGGVLREKTHQHALAGVTFALVALGAAVFLALAARRLAMVLAALRTRRRTLGTLAALAATTLSFAALALRVLRAAPSLSGSGRATLIDGLAFALALAFFARKAFEDRRMLARLGPPAGFVLLVLSMHALANAPSAVLAIRQACPVHFALLKGFAHLTL